MNKKVKKEPLVSHVEPVIKKALLRESESLEISLSSHCAKILKNHIKSNDNL